MFSFNIVNGILGLTGINNNLTTTVSLTRYRNYSDTVIWLFSIYTTKSCIYNIYHYNNINDINNNIYHYNNIYYYININNNNIKINMK